MGDTIGSLTRHAARAACLALMLAGPALAQGPAIEGGQTQIPPAPASPEFMSRADFHLMASAISNDDPRFKWDTHFGGDIDLVDYVSGRIRVAGDYQALLGNEYRPFDPNQGNYVLEPSASLRVAGFEVAFLLHHESRHLSDRPKRFSVDWNLLGGRVLKRIDAGATTVELEAGFGGVYKHTFTDYKRIGDADVLIRHTVSPHAIVYVRGTGELFGVDGTIPRDNQRGGRAEVGVRLTGRAGAVELFGGLEQMVDAYPTERVPRRWPFAGFRLTSR
jgi:hypothetical protein